MTMLEGLEKQAKTSLSVYVNQDTLNKIDKIRGETVPRSRVVQRALEMFLARETATAQKGELKSKNDI
jgi:hypothetical protein